MTSIGLRPALLFFSLTGVNTAASISARKLSNGTTRAIISSGSPFAEIAASRLSASKNPNCPIVPTLANLVVTSQTRTNSRRSLFFEVPITFFPHRAPPSANGVDRKSGRVVICSHADPTGVVANIVNAVRHRAFQFGIDEVMDIDVFGAVLGPPFTARILEIAHQFLLFCIHRNNRLAVFQEGCGARVDVLKLRVSIHMLVAFAGFAVRLQAIARLLQKLAHQGVADLMSFVRQLFAQLAQTARSP